MFTLDTNTLIYYFKDIGGVTKHLLAVPPRNIFIPTIVVYEIEVGIAQSVHPEKRRAQFDTFLTLVSVLPFDKQIAKTAASIRVKLESKGSLIGPLDTLIAGTALAHGSTLVTHNTREFSKVDGLKLADWYKK